MLGLDMLGHLEYVLRELAEVKCTLVKVVHQMPLNMVAVIKGNILSPKILSHRFQKQRIMCNR